MTNHGPSRRRFLQAGALALTAGLAGCGSSAPAAQEGSGDSATTTGPSPYTRVYREAIDSVLLVETRQGSGTGWVYDGTHVVTNAHVVGDATAVDLRTRDGRWHTGEVIGTDPNSDLAVIEPDGLTDAATPLSLAESPATIGQEVVAIGNPFDLDGSVTTGVVSGTDRSIPAPTGFSIPDAIQTDAAVNPGNSGGPLMALDGRVVAVINSGGGDNIAFGISAALARRVLPELIETGSFEHSFLGVSVTTVTPAVAEANRLTDPRGLLVVTIAPDGPVDGVFQPSEDAETVEGERIPVGGDVLLAVDGTRTDTTEALGSYLALETRPGDTVSMTILRDGEEQTVEVELGTRPTRPS
ncbi:S1C family serine protease [Haloplanus aerogenes]|uniref:PDZ domain-containing protein n=1 Tax=Haloplanus aerogenes TaxID=660522 RepID=A0A3M0DPY1_9EURY|nr:trypsin-like peptidase domain-containing protein [Haloplanus aerogenes]AZH24563.1 PDZ domain-containing protein [Haloplanus aerogenes]RMB23782.1 S1-C subfamily serine protease [Haloplanus aerogenes]